ncbi:MAG: AmmeMemoRadiSam system radical SAM enzyme [Pirellulales bacterium]|nr:AmmeMemoRadiSam system radical SAM enzyme [Pirellulales bacterium]
MERVVTTPPEGQSLPDGSMPGGWWHESDDGQRVVCDVCPRACSLRSGDRGFCFVRENRDGQVVSTTYGRSTGFCVDPIEKKPLNQFYPGTAVLSFGTAGCNLGCKFCQNWTMSRSHDVDAACELADPETIATAARQLGCRSVAFTYNDPIIWAEYAIDTARACHRQGVKTVAVTSGYMQPAAREAFYRHMDAANVDLKAFSEEFYRDYTGGHLEPVIDTLRWLAHQSDTWVEITNLVIPRANDSPEEIERMCRWIVEELGPDVPLHFSAFHPDFKLTDRPRTPVQTLTAAHEIARRAGLRYVYTGNVSDRMHQSTSCPECGRVVIGRDGYVLGVYDVVAGRCRHCQAPIAGRFDDGPGHWGGRRLPVRIDTYARPNNPTPLAKENTKMESLSRPSPVGAGATQRPELTEQQESSIFQAAGRRVAAAVHAQTPESMESLLAEIAETPVYGAFVSLKRGGQLRSCCGFMGESVPLSEALDRAAFRTATDDPRFPPISASELAHLDMEVWLLWGLQLVTARGEDRVQAVTIGKHGLQIARGASRGLLLPGVAVDHDLDAKGFLKQVCLKAGLPPDAWREDDTSLWTFEGYAVRGKLGTVAGEETPLEAAALRPTPDEVAALADFSRRNVIALVQGATPSFYLPGGYDGGIAGLAVTVGQPQSPQRIEVSRLSVRPEIPLQTTLFGLTEAAARALRARHMHPTETASLPFGLTVLRDPAMHGTAAQPELQGIDPRRRAVLVIDASRSAWVFDPQKTPQALFDEALQRGGFTDPARASVISLAAISTDPRVAIAHVPRPQAGPEVRPTAVAGAFYPATAQQIDHELDAMLPKEKPQPEPWPAVMVPHAGWQYSGRLAAEVFSRVEIPEQVIVLCPKHRPGGSEWAVAPHGTWDLPGRSVPSDPELAQRLAGAVTGLELDAAAHRQEHAIEVHLPILARLAPQARVVGITVGGGQLAGLRRFAEQMAELLRDLRPRPLLVISSDMNHFAGDQETRRLDRMALEAIESLDPEQLYETVRDHGISMCGVMPAVIVMETLRRLEGLNRCESVGYATSADASGDTSRVVGYAGMLLG